MYDFRTIEAKWQKYWDKHSIYSTSEHPSKKYYILEMYAYPSGDLHIGHFRNYILGDAISRFKLMQGYDCLHPFGWDSFGLPAEEAAIKQGISPRQWTMDNIATSRSTLKLMGISYDWNREIITSEQDYYKWTQWLFLKLHQRGLAYRKSAYVNWCPHCQTTLANEQVKNGECWRCGTLVTQKELTQWFIKITDYAERLLKNLDTLTYWPERVKQAQRYWIGKSEGVEIDFEYNGRKLPVFTTRADTIYGVTFIAISPLDELASEFAQGSQEIRNYVETAIRGSISRGSTSNRTDLSDKTGIFTYKYAVNPISGESVPIWISDYVLPTYGTGVIMGVPAHDERDFEFSKIHSIPIRQVITEDRSQKSEVRNSLSSVLCPLTSAYTGEGVMVHSGSFTGLSSTEGREAIIKHIKNKQIGREKVNYHLKDWLISRQRYWGAPIPIIYCPNCNVVPVPIEQLPILLPSQVDFTPKGSSPLASVEKFINTKCPKCGSKAQRDTDTMDTFVDSSWYWLRYLDPHNDEAPINSKLASEWLPIDEYIGGIEHATGHLLYFRFISHFLHNEGLIPYEEPCIKLFTQGMIKDEQGKVMSKSKGNAVPVGPFAKEYGADVGRIAVLFIGPPEQDAEWSIRGVAGALRFLNRVYTLFFANRCEQKPLYFFAFPAKQVGVGGEGVPAENKLYKTINRVIKKVTEDIENHSHNTAIATLMTLTNELYKAQRGTPQDEWFGYGMQVLVQLLAPFAPHLSEELWIEKLGNSESVFKSSWPKWEEIEEEMATIIIEVQGKVRAQINLPVDTTEQKVKEKALQIQNVVTRVKEIKKVVFVPNKLINFVIE
ncbi:MAG: leucine--tRNA ligase [Candidatus Stahlbacteria bacterium]|nr:leucine--tRNA ligase [Candidatus Stahlbacteria bacterium]